MNRNHTRWVVVLLLVALMHGCGSSSDALPDAGGHDADIRDAAVLDADDAAIDDAQVPDAGNDSGVATGKRIVMADYLGFNLPLLSVVDTVPVVAVNEALYTASVTQLKALGLRRVRVDFHWAVMEPTQGQESAIAFAVTDDLIGRLRDDGIEVLVQLGGVPEYYAAVGCDPSVLGSDTCPPSEAGIAALAMRMVQYAQRWPSIEHWQIGNEPNLSRYAETQYDGLYARTAQAVVDAFAAAGITHKLALAGMGYYGDYTPSPGPQYITKTGSMLLDVVNNHPTLIDGLDAVAYHPYTDAPEGEPGGLNPMTAGVFVERAGELNADLRVGGHVKEIWATEFGWSTYQALTGVVVQTPISLDTQADYYLRRLALTFGLDFDRAYLFNLADMGPGPETLTYVPVTGTARDDFYGVITRAGTPKPAYTALARFLSVTGPVLTEAPAFTTVEGVDSATLGTHWTRNDGKHVWMVRAETARTVSIPGVSAAVIHDCVAGTETPATVNAGAVVVPVSTNLMVIVY